jgi:hypothetical protein
MKTAISIPDPLFNSAERAARRFHLSRSKLFTTAISHYLGQIKCHDVTDRLNAIYDRDHPLSELPKGVGRMQAMSLPGEKW